MKRFLITLFVGVLVGALGMWFLLLRIGPAPAAQSEAPTRETVPQVGETVSGATADLKESLAAKLDALELTAQDIRQDLQQSGSVVRRRARDLAKSAADATADLRTTAAIKTKLAADPDLSALAISVDTTDGRVTLAGTVSSIELIGRAIALSLETDGVREVVSTLRVE